MSAPLSFQSLVVVVVQPVNAAAPGNLSVPCAGPPFGPSCVQGIGHPVEPLSDVRRADARSAEIGSPCGVARGFQVSAYKVEPLKAVFARNLLAKDDWRAALADEPVERGPKVPLVSKPSTFASRGEGLAGAGAGPDGSIVGPACQAQSV
jgi:hypothetical protein